MITNTFHSEVSHEPSTWLPFNSTHWPQDHTTHATLFAHQDYNPFYVTQPPPSIYFMTPMDGFDPAAQLVSFVASHRKRRANSLFLLMLQKYRTPRPQAIINSIRLAQQSTVPRAKCKQSRSGHSVLDTGNKLYEHPVSVSSFDIPVPSPSLPDESPLLGHATGNTIETYMRYEAGAARWLCLNCNERSNSRKNRMRDHVAQCLGHKLYLCGGGCGVDSWYEPFSSDPFGSFRELRTIFVAIESSEPIKIFKIIEIHNDERA